MKKEDITISKKIIAMIAVGAALTICLPLSIRAQEQDILLDQPQDSQEIILDQPVVSETVEQVPTGTPINEIKPLESKDSAEITIKPAPTDANLSYINKQRKTRGLNPLKYSKGLYNAALTRAKEQRQLISHTRPNGKAWNTIAPEIQGGEIIAFYVDDIQTAVQMWNGSPSHADLLWDNTYKTAAVAKVDDFYVVEFGY